MPKLSLTTIDPEELQLIIDKSTSHRDVLISMGYNVGTRAYRQLHNVVVKFDLKLDKMFSNHAKMKLDKNYFEKKTNPVLKRKDLKKILIGVEEKCSLCGLHEWFGKPIVCHIDHIDGNRNNNNCCNLRYLCPNCHSQTPTYAGKNCKKKHFCSCCKAEVLGYRTYCDKCLKIQKEKLACDTMKFFPSKEELENKLIELKYNMSAAGRYYGVSDNSVRKRCRKFNLKFS